MLQAKVVWNSMDEIVRIEKLRVCKRGLLHYGTKDSSGKKRALQRIIRTFYQAASLNRNDVRREERLPFFHEKLTSKSSVTLVFGSGIVKDGVAFEVINGKTVDLKFT